MLHSPMFEIGPYIAIARRRIWWSIVPFFLVVLGGLGFLKVAPKVYKATTLILLEPQSIPDSYVRATVTESFAGRIRTIEQQIKSRTNLERIITDFQLHQRPSREREQVFIQWFSKRLPFLANRDGSDSPPQRMELMNQVGRMRKNLTVVMRAGGPASGGREQNLAFEINFEWEDPDKVASVLNAIAARFIEQNLSIREEKAISTTDFLDKETVSIKRELEAKEKELETFKRENMGALPDQLQSNLNILQQLSEQLLNLERSMEQDKQQAMLLRAQGQIARVQQGNGAVTIANDARRHSEGLHGRQMSTQELLSGSLVELERELEHLSSQYTGKHPDIIALQRRIETLKREGTSPGHSPSRTSAEELPQEIRLQLVPINARIDSYQKEIKELNRQIAMYKERVERTPEIEMSMNKLLRGYETVRQRYDNLLIRKLDAKMAEEMERRQKGEQFRILDPAVRPGSPYKPDVPRILMLAVGGGLCLGCGLAYLREIFDPCFYSPKALESYLDAHVIVSIPIAHLESESKRV